MEVIVLKILIILNYITFAIFGIDKIAAKKKDERISEQTLLLFSILGGAIGANIAMMLFNHKTSKSKFKKVIPIFSIIYFLVITYLILKNI